MLWTIVVQNARAALPNVGSLCGYYNSMQYNNLRVSGRVKGPGSPPGIFAAPREFAGIFCQA